MICFFSTASVCLITHLTIKSLTELITDCWANDAYPDCWGSPKSPRSTCLLSTMAQLVSRCLSLNYLVRNWFTTFSTRTQEWEWREAGKLHTRMMEQTAKYTRGGKKQQGENIISHQILISYCEFEYKSSVGKVHSNLPRKILSFEIVSIVLWGKRKKWKLGIRWRILSRF